MIPNKNPSDESTKPGRIRSRGFVQDTLQDGTYSKRWLLFRLLGRGAPKKIQIAPEGEKAQERGEKNLKAVEVLQPGEALALHLLPAKEGFAGQGRNDEGEGEGRVAGVEGELYKAEQETRRKKPKKQGDDKKDPGQSRAFLRKASHVCRQKQRSWGGVNDKGGPGGLWELRF